MDKNLEETLSKAVEQAKQDALELNVLLVLSDQLVAAGESNQSIMLYRLWIEHTKSPMVFVAYYNLGALLCSAGDDAAAEQVYRQAIAIKTDFIHAWLNLGSVLERLGRQEEALEQWRQVLDFPVPEDKSLYLQALNNLGRLLEIRHQFSEAEEMLKRSLLMDSTQSPVVSHWVHLRQKQCKWPVYDSLKGLTVADMVKATSPIAMLGLSDDPALQLAAARNFVDENVKIGVEPLCNVNGYGHKKLRIGYLSSNFSIHAVSLLTVEIFELHDRERVEVYGFCWSGEDVTSMRARIANAMDHYIRTVDMNDQEAAQCIRSHEIDILIDLQGLTSGARPNILSARPAPIQVSYLGYPGTTGFPCNDYVIADKFVLPEELAPYFSEKPLYMPNSFQVSDRGRLIGARPTRAACGLPEDAFVFCSFNNNFKFTPDVFSTWMRILKRVPNSVLWLLADNEWSKERLCKVADKFGIKRKRLIFAPRVAPPDYLARYQVADLFLDTCPFNAGTTANDALWVGLPLLTCAGRTFSSRMAGSLLKAVDLPELITYNLKDYENKAVELAKTPERIAAMKQQLTDNRQSCTLFDIPRFVRDLEDALEQVAIKCFTNQSVEALMTQARTDVDSTMPLVSVLIPTHNRPDYLEIALKSALAQSYENIEIVISDNGDDALSQERVTPYLQSHQHITYYRKQGMTAHENFRKCLELSKGEYINYLMDDDVFHPDKIKRMMHYYINYPNTGLVTSFRQLIDEHGRHLPPLQGTERMFPSDTLITGQSFGNLMLSNGTNLVGEPTTVLVRRSDVGDVFGTFAGRRYVVLSDIATWLSILSTRDCVYISDPLSYFRIHDAQDQRDNTMKIKASIEWFGLFFDAHKNRMFLEDHAEFLSLLAGKLAAFSSYIALNYSDIRDGDYDRDEIYGVINQAYLILLEK